MSVCICAYIVCWTMLDNKMNAKNNVEISEILYFMNRRYEIMPNVTQKITIIRFYGTDV